MKSYQKIEQKLAKFMQKYYMNELLRGSILFFSIGLLYLVFTLFIESFLWLSPSYRGILFWLFISVEFFLFTRYILIPISKILKLNSGISKENAAKIIGNHFPEVKDKLLNVLQLQKLGDNSELVIASIKQKEKELEPISFKKAIQFASNKKYIKYAALPILIIILVYLFGKNASLENSFERVVNYTETYEPPAPFSFIVPKDISVIEGGDLLLKIKTKGAIEPDNVKLIMGNESFYLQKKGVGAFEYQLFNIKKATEFYLEAAGINSSKHTISVLKKPMIQSLLMKLNYPRYTHKKPEIIKHTGNAVVPKGTIISWQIKTSETEKIIFKETEKQQRFTKKGNNFSFTKKVVKTIPYEVVTSNDYLQNYESLQFNIQVVNDEYPKIQTRSFIDSIGRKPMQFAGRVMDDYGISKLQLVYYDKNTPTIKKTHLLPFVKGTYSDFYYTFPDSISLEKEINYNFYFEVFDNDGINGAKSSKSNVFNYYKNTDKELENKLLEEQKNTIESISKSIYKVNKQLQKGDDLQKSLLEKKQTDWKDKQKLENFLKRQESYKNMMQKQSNKLKENLEEMKVSEKMKEKKEELLKRIEETKKMSENDKEILKELEELAKKMNKNNMFQKLKKLANQNKRNEMTLKRILELTKRFYVQQKTDQIAEKLKDLSKKQLKETSKKEENNRGKKLKEQNKINEEFKNIEKQLDNLKKENTELKQPMELPKTSDKKEDIKKALQKANENLKKGNSREAKKQQQKSAKSMEKLSKVLKDAMEMGEMKENMENKDDLEKIVKNLLVYSFEQEDIMKRFSEMKENNPQFSEKIKKQHSLKKHFEHIDDSLYVLSLRVPSLTNLIQNEVGKVHYSIDNALHYFPEGNSTQGIYNQRVALTSANTLADILSNTLQQMQKPKPKMGMCNKPGENNPNPMKDIIKKHSKMMKDMKSGKNKGKGKKEGEKKGNGKEGENGELYEIYKQQEQIKNALKGLLKGEKEGKNGKKGNGDKVVKEMDELQKELLKKGLTDELFKKHQSLNYKLLELEKATFNQGEDNKRVSKNPKEKLLQKESKMLEFEKLKWEHDEILQRKSLPFKTIYKQKVQEYFKQQ